MSITLNFADPGTFVLMFLAGAVVLAGFALFGVQIVAWGIEYSRLRQRMKRVRDEADQLDARTQRRKDYR